MIKLEIDTYFAQKGISVRYNTLGNNQELMRSYTKEFQNMVDFSIRKKSQYVKHACYSKLYNIEPRIKYTGFENFKKLDNQFRNCMRSYIIKPQHSGIGLVMDSKENTNNMSYKETLIRSLKTTVDPVLYFSGGLDSELVALALLEANIKFTTVIFEYVDKSGKIQNTNELQYAYKFCRANCLIPEVYQIDIETLWSTDYFKKLSIDLQLLSPQIVTHAYMIEMLSLKYKNSTHLFGGEVRFESDYLMDDGNLANLVFLNKVDPVGYNAGLYSSTTEGAFFSALVALSYFGSIGEWGVSAQGTLTKTPSSLPESGQFTTTPAFQYQARTTNMTGIFSNVTGDGYTALVPAIADAVYFNISSVGTMICSAEAGATSGSASTGATWTIQVRSTTEPAIVVTSTIRLEAFTTAGF